MTDQDRIERQRSNWRIRWQRKQARKIEAAHREPDRAPFVHRIISAAEAEPITVRAPASVWELA